MLFHKKEKIVYLLKPSFFCQWVESAVSRLDKLVEEYPNKNIFCVNDIVNNNNIVSCFKKRWVKFVSWIDEIDDKDGVVVFSVHWVDRQLYEQAKTKFKNVYNFECNLITQIYDELDKNKKEKRVVFFVWNENHNIFKWLKAYSEKLWFEFYFFENEQDIPKLLKDTKILFMWQCLYTWKHIQSLYEKILKKFQDVKVPILNNVCDVLSLKEQMIVDNKERFNTLLVVWSEKNKISQKLFDLWINYWKDTYLVNSLEDLLNKLEKTILSKNTIAIIWWPSTSPQSMKDVFDYFLDNWYNPWFLWVKEEYKLSDL